jgi:PAP2 superfamily
MPHGKSGENRTSQPRPGPYSRSMRVALLSRTHRGSVEVAAAVALYAVYELIRGMGGENWTAARLHTDEIVNFERSLGLYWERGIQHASFDVPGLPAVLGFLYLALHLVGTTAFLIWVYRNRRQSFARVRTTIVAATGLALVGYVLYPAAPPRLADLGFADAVSSHTKLNLSSDLLGALYNPIAAVPSLHFGYALVVGVGLAVLAQRRWVRIIGALYPPAMLYIIVATGNHFWLDAALGGAVVVAAWLVAAAVTPAPGSARLRPWHSSSRSSAAPRSPIPSA